MRSLLLLAAFALAMLGCVDYPPSFAYVDGPVAPASADGYDLEVAKDTAVAVVFEANDHSKFSGESGATGARSLDESIARVSPSSRKATVHDGAAANEGTIFLVAGVSPGETEIEVLLDGESKGTLRVKVVAQSR